MAITVTIEAELSVGAWTDLSQDTVAEAGMSVSWGMDGGRPDDNCATPGTFSVTLNNAATVGGGLVGRYSPGHANATAGWDLNTPLRLTLSDGTTSRVMGPYRVVSLSPEPGIYGSKRVVVTAADWLEEAAQSPVSGAAPGTAGEFIRSLVDGVAATPEGYDIDSGASPVVYAASGLSGRNDRVLAALKSAAQSDGGHFYLTSAGVATYRSASARAADATADFTFVDDMHALSAGRDRESLVNTMRLTVHPPVVSTTYVVVAALAAPLLVAAGASVSMWMPYRDPDTGDACGVYATPRTPERNVDWRANSREDGTGGDVSVNWVVEHDDYSDSAVLVTISNIDSADGYLTLLNVRAISVVDADPVTVQAVNSTSVAAYGERVLDVDMPYQHDPNIAQALADYWRVLYSDATMRATAVGVKEIGTGVTRGYYRENTSVARSGYKTLAGPVFATTAGQSYTFSGYLDPRRTNINMVAMKFNTEGSWHEGNYCYPSSGVSGAVPLNQFKLSSVTFTAPVGSVSCALMIFCSLTGTDVMPALSFSSLSFGITGGSNLLANGAFADGTLGDSGGNGVGWATLGGSAAGTWTKGVEPASLALTADVGSRVNLTESMLGLVSAPYWVQGVAMQIAEGPVFNTTLHLAPASNDTPWLLEVTGRTELGTTTVLGYL
jgi:hypothetical protein